MSETHSRDNGSTTTERCVWCFEACKDGDFDHSAVAWKLYRDDKDCHLACKFCAEEFGIWAVGEDGEAWQCGSVGDPVPRLPYCDDDSEEWGISIDSMVSNDTFTGRDPGMQGVRGLLA